MAEACCYKRAAATDVIFQNAYAIEAAEILAEEWDE